MEILFDSKFQDLHNCAFAFARLFIKMLFSSMNIIIGKFRTNEMESLFQCEGFSDRQIGMEALIIDWAKQEEKMAKIFRNIHVYC